MKNEKIAFIGAGNMASALIGGLIAGNDFKPDDIYVSDLSDEKLNLLATNHGIQTSGDNLVIAAKVDTIVLCVKPQVMAEICQQIAATVQQNSIMVISIAAGISVADMENWLGEKTAVVRAMPNTPALVQTGATGLYANEQVNEAQIDIAEKILRAVGVVLWIKQEQQMDVVTALSGSGPAYFFRVMEAMEQAACELGLSSEEAHLLTLQTALGAAKLAIESNDSVAELRQKVTSPGGTTEKGLEAMQLANVDKMFQSTLIAASDRAAELSNEFGGK